MKNFVEILIHAALLTSLVGGCSRGSVHSSPHPNSDDVPAHGHCSQGLSKDILDSDQYSSDANAKEYLAENACRTLSSYDGDNDARWSQDCSSSSNDASLDAIIESVPIGVDPGYQSGHSDSYCRDAGTRQAYRHVWYQHMCQSTGASAICEIVDECELGRLRGLFLGQIPTWEAYLTLQAQNMTVVYEDGHLIGIGPCSPAG